MKNISKERIDAGVNAIIEFKKQLRGKEFDTKVYEEYYSMMCKEIKAEKKRLGGNWIIAGAIRTKALTVFNVSKQIRLN